MSGGQEDAARELESTLRDRGKTYGSFADRARITQAIKRAMVDSPNWETLSDDNADDAFVQVGPFESRLNRWEVDHVSPLALRHTASAVLVTQLSQDKQSRKEPFLGFLITSVHPRITPLAARQTASAAFSLSACAR